MSGGKSKKDPYYQKDPPKRTKKAKDPQGQLKSYKNAVKPKRIEVLPGGRRRYYYDCEHCGKEYSTDKRKKHRRSLCGKACQYEWQKYGQEHHVPTQEEREAQSRRSKEMWKDPKRRKRMTKRIKDAYAKPEVRKRKSKIAKEVASRPEWRRRQSKSQRGKKRSPEVGRKVSAAKMGHSVSKETRKKLAEANRGEKCYFWKGGISGEKEKFYRSWQWRSQSDRAKKRDGHICQGCGWTEDEVKEAGGKLNGHHVIPLEDYDGEWHRYPDEMVTTLCMMCHGASEYQDGDEKWPINGRGEDAKLDRLVDLRTRQTAMDEFDDS